jgi:chromosome partitioning protein
VPVITIASLKGGVGKTTTAIHLAHALALQGHQTLLVDSDPSRHTSRFFLPRRDTEHSHSKSESQPSGGIRNLLKPIEELRIEHNQHGLTLKGVPPNTIRYNVREHLDLIPATEFLADLSIHSPHDKNSGAKIDYYLADALAVLSEVYEYIVIDTGPLLNTITRNALRAASLIVLPIDSTCMSLDSISDLILFDADSNTSTEKVVLRNMLVRSASRTNQIAGEHLHERLYEACVERGQETGYSTEFAFSILETIVYRSESFNRVGYLHETVFEINARDRGCESFHALADELKIVLAPKQSNSTNQTSPRKLHHKEEAHRAI